MRVSGRASLVSCLVLIAVTFSGCALNITPTTAPTGSGNATPVARRVPLRSILLIIDKSGSMSYDVDSGEHSIDEWPKLDMAKAAAQDVLVGMTRYDWYGVLAFNDEQLWVVPLRQLQVEEDRQQAAAAIEGLTPDDGTENFPALALGIGETITTDTEDRRIVLVTDGKSRSGTREEYQQLTELTAIAGITISTVGIGSDVDAELLELLATEGSGRYVFVETPEEIPAAVMLALGLSPATPTPASATPAPAST